MQNQFNQLSDFVDDPGFQNWVHRRHAEDQAFWDDWIQRHPEHKATVREAAAIVRGIPARPLSPQPEAQAAVWARIEARLNLLTADTDDKVKPFPWRWLMAASIILGVVGSLLIWQYTHPDRQVFETGYGESRVVYLPDSSTVTLNAQSRLSYQASWEDVKMREVWLEGEAYFSVKKHADQLPFRVYSGEMTIEVLGTEFNVRQRGNEAEVALEEGAVRLSHRNVAEPVLLEPGQVAEYVEAEQQFHTETVNTETLTSWKDQLMVFDETPIPEIAERIEEIFGVPVVVEGETLKSRQLSGRISSVDLDVLLKALSLSFQIEVDYPGDTIYIKP